MHRRAGARSRGLCCAGPVQLRGPRCVGLTVLLVPTPPEERVSPDGCQADVHCLTLCWESLWPRLPPRLPPPPDLRVHQPRNKLRPWRQSGSLACVPTGRRVLDGTEGDEAADGAAATAPGSLLVPEVAAQPPAGTGEGKSCVLLRRKPPSHTGLAPHGRWPAPLLAGGHL